MLSLAEIHRSRDYITHEKLWIQSLRNSNIEYRNGSYLFGQGRWRGFDWSDVRLESLEGKTLIIGHSDDEVTLDIAAEILQTSRPKRIYATNLSAEASILAETTDLPLGIPNEERQSKTHIIQADHSLLRKAWRKGSSPSTFDDVRIHANFSIRNNVIVRKEALESVKGLPRVRVGVFKLSKRGRLEDLLSMRESGLVLCPRGAGMDTHRFWESLLVGAIPVVLKSDHSFRLAQLMELPIVSVDTWADLRNDKNIEDQWNKIHERRWDFSPLSSNYWVKKIFPQLSQTSRMTSMSHLEEYL